MEIVRSKPDPSQTSALMAELGTLNCACVGCSNCNGLCAELIDALTIPELILSRKRQSQ